MNSSIKRYHREYTNNKFERPFSPDHAMHITLRSEMAQGSLSLLVPSTSSWIKAYIPSLVKRLPIRIYAWSLNSNHLHFVLQAACRKALQSFLRTLASRITRFVLKGQSGNRFWSKRPYSRTLTWGREFKNALRYVLRNAKEAIGKMLYVSRSDRAAMRRTNQVLAQILDSQERKQQLVLRL